MSQTLYQDFEMEISPARSNPQGLPLYQIRATSAASDMRATSSQPVVLTLTGEELTDFFYWITYRRIQEFTAKAPEYNFRRAVVMGEQLVAFLLHQAEIKQRYFTVQKEALQAGRGVRLRLKLNAPELHSLPWEYLCDTTNHNSPGFLAVAPGWELVRDFSLPPSHSNKSLLNVPCRVLVLVGTQTARQHAQKLTQLFDSENSPFIFEIAPMSDYNNLSNWLSCQPPFEFVHYVGTAGYDTTTKQSFLAMSDENGKNWRLDGQSFERLIGSQPPQLIVLNACYPADTRGTADRFSNFAAPLSTSSTAVLATNYTITNASGRNFVRRFYLGLAQGQSIEESLALARRAVPNLAEVGLPVYYAHSSQAQVRLSQPQPSLTLASVSNSNEDRLAEIEELLQELTALRDYLQTRLLEKLPAETTLTEWRTMDIELDKSERELTEQLTKLKPAPSNPATVNIPTKKPPFRSPPTFNIGELTVELDAPQYVQKGEELYNKYDPILALQKFQKAVELAPNMARAYLGQGKCYLLIAGHVQQAIESLRTATQLDPQCEDAYLYLAQALAADVSILKTEILKALDRVLELNSGKAEAYQMRGKLYFQFKRFQDAAADFHKLVQLKPNNAEGYYWLAIAYYHSEPCKTVESRNAFHTFYELTNGKGTADANIKTVLEYLSELEVTLV
jgi:tetratricopeptide (TPR) repeat protein